MYSNINNSLPMMIIEWQSYMECASAKSTTDQSQCQAKGADYYECLHHKKEVSYQ